MIIRSRVVFVLTSRSWLIDWADGLIYFLINRHCLIGWLFERKNDWLTFWNAVSIRWRDILLRYDNTTTLLGIMTRKMRIKAVLYATLIWLPDHTCSTLPVLDLYPCPQNTCDVIAYPFTSAAQQICCWGLITSAKEVMFLPEFVCLFVCVLER